MATPVTYNTRHGNYTERQQVVQHPKNLTTLFSIALARARQAENCIFTDCEV